MRRRRQEATEMTPYQQAVEQLVRDVEEDGRRQQAYKLACQMDAAGNHIGADEVLRAAGVAPDVVRQRREHIAWRMGQGLPAIGDTR